MSFEDVYETLPGDGWLTKEEAEFLYNKAKDSQRAILEVGCYKGRSTVLLASFNRPVFCVDPFSNFDESDISGDSIYEIWNQNLAERGIKNIDFIRGKIEQVFYPYITEKFGFAYLDGDHTYLGSMNQLNKATEWNIPKICMHDYAFSGGGLNIKRAIEDSLQYRLKEVVGTMAYCELQQ